MFSSQRRESRGKVTLQLIDQMKRSSKKGQIFSNESEELISFFYVYIYSGVSIAMSALEKYSKWKWLRYYTTRKLSFKKCIFYQNIYLHASH